MRLCLVDQDGNNSIFYSSKADFALFVPNEFMFVNFKNSQLVFFTFGYCSDYFEKEKQKQFINKSK